MRFAALVGALVQALVAIPGTAAATHSWRIVDLGAGDSSWATAINERGHVVGSNGANAFLWRDGQLTYIGPGEAKDINNRDEVVGNLGGAGFLWRDGVIPYLPGMAYAINDCGDVAGFDWVGAYVWRDGVTTYLDPLPGTLVGQAEDINNAGVVVGSSIVGVLSDFAVRWRDGNVEALSTTERGAARAINQRGSITGSHFGSWGIHGFLWHKGEFITIAPPPEASFIQPHGINDRMQIVGDTDFDAFMWQAGQLTLLPRLVATSSASDVNNRGQIVGSSAARSDGLNPHAVLWTR